MEYIACRIVRITGKYYEKHWFIWLTRFSGPVCLGLASRVATWYCGQDDRLIGGVFIQLWCNNAFVATIVCLFSCQAYCYSTSLVPCHIQVVSCPSTLTETSKRNVPAPPVSENGTKKAHKNVGNLLSSSHVAFEQSYSNNRNFSLKVFSPLGLIKCYLLGILETTSNINICKQWHSCNTSIEYAYKHTQDAGTSIPTRKNYSNGWKLYTFGAHINVEYITHHRNM